MIEITNLHKSFGKLKVIKGIDLKRKKYIKNINLK